MGMSYCPHCKRTGNFLECCGRRADLDERFDDEDADLAQAAHERRGEHRAKLRAEEDENRRIADEKFNANLPSLLAEIRGKHGKKPTTS